MIPSKNRKEWHDILNPDSSVQLNCFALQMKVSKLKRELADEKITIENAIDDLRALCEKYARAVEKDMINIFGN